MTEPKLSTIRVVSFLLVLLLAPLSVNAGSIIPTKYDDYFKDATLLLPAGTDWRLLKSQCYQESRLNPLAVSPVGAFGLCQFMPATAREVTSKYNLGSLWEPETSVRAAALYMNQQLQFWSSPRPQMDRYMLALCNYNAGAGNCLKAQRECGGALLWREIATCLPNVTGHHSKETIGYVTLIVGKWYPLLLF